MDRPAHIIHRVNLEIEAPDLNSARNLQDEALLLFNNEILPRIEKWLDGLFQEEYYRLDRLDLDLAMGDRLHFDVRFSEDAVQVIQESILKSIAPLKGEIVDGPEIKANAIDPLDRPVDRILYFLETGRLPWWSEKAGKFPGDESLFLEALQSSPDVVLRFLQLIKNHPLAIERLVLQYPVDILVRVTSVCLAGRADLDATDISNRIGHLFNSFEADAYFDIPARTLQLILLKKLLLQVARSEGISVPRLLDELYREIRQEAMSTRNEITLEGTVVKSEKAEAERQKSGNAWKIKGEEDGIYVQQAGLVLLHPFLEYCFSDFGLLEKGQFKNDESRSTALHLLHYLATGREAPMEYELTFEKYLAGMDLEKPVDRFIPLSDAMKEECDTLLRAAIGHWKALKNTSPDGLREGFLQRDGKLVLDGFQHRLIVEHQSIDVLLSHLPWGFGIIKLPWFNEPLMVEWTT